MSFKKVIVLFSLLIVFSFIVSAQFDRVFVKKYNVVQNINQTGVSNDFDQSLNTSDDVKFNQVEVFSNRTTYYNKVKINDISNTPNAGFTLESDRLGSRVFSFESNGNNVLFRNIVDDLGNFLVQNEGGDNPFSVYFGANDGALSIDANSYVNINDPSIITDTVNIKQISSRKGIRVINTAGTGAFTMNLNDAGSIYFTGSGSPFFFDPGISLLDSKYFRFGGANPNVRMVYNHLSDDFEIYHSKDAGGRYEIFNIPMNEDVINVPDKSMVISKSLSLGSNSLNGLSDGDLNVSNIYYDTLNAKSPVFLCSDDWCSVSFPKYQKTLWIEKDFSWNVLSIVYDGVSYTKGDFNSVICDLNNNIRDICDKLNSKVTKLKNKNDCNFEWDGENCFEVVKQVSDYESSVVSYFEDVYVAELYDCEKLGDDLIPYNSTCENKVFNHTENKFKFVDGCGWEEGFGYYCEEVVLR